MSDPFSDPRAQQLLSADCGEIGAVASQLISNGAQAGHIAGALNAIAGDVSWTGAAADQYRSAVGQLPNLLNEIADSQSNAGWALQAYGGQDLPPLQQQFRALMSQLQGAGVNAYTGGGGSAGGQASPQSAGVNACPSGGGSAGDQASLQKQIAAAQQQGNAILDQFSSVRQTAIAALVSAGPTAGAVIAADPGGASAPPGWDYHQYHGQGYIALMADDPDPTNISENPQDVVQMALYGNTNHAGDPAVAAQTQAQLKPTPGDLLPNFPQARDALVGQGANAHYQEFPFGQSEITLYQQIYQDLAKEWGLASGPGGASQKNQQVQNQLEEAALRQAEAQSQPTAPNSDGGDGTDSEPDPFEEEAP